MKMAIENIIDYEEISEEMAHFPYMPSAETEYRLKTI